MNNINNTVIFSINTDTSYSSKINVFCYAFKNDKGIYQTGSIEGNSNIKHFLGKFDYFVSWDIVRFKAPIIKKATGFDIKNHQCIDLLGLSWAMFPNMETHYQWAWEKELGLSIHKKDRSKSTIDETKEDVELLIKLFDKFNNDLQILYQDSSAIYKYIEYISLKLQCLVLQDMYPFTFNIKRANIILDRFENTYNHKYKILADAMPTEKLYDVVNPPTVIYSRGNVITKQGGEWIKLLKEKGLPLTFNNPVEVIKKEMKGNPNNSDSVKEWLFSLGWKPEDFKDGDTNNTPLIYIDKELSQSVKKIAEKNRAVKELENYSSIKHRIAVLSGLIDYSYRCADAQLVVASAEGFTTTLRVKHRGIVNLPSVTGNRDIIDGQWIRECFTTDKGKELCVVDLNALEDKIKQHFIYDIDREYVKKINEKEFNPHFDIGIKIGLFDENDVKWFNVNKKSTNLSSDDTDRFNDIYAKYKKAKNINYSAIYGVSSKTLSKLLKCSIDDAGKFLNIYWETNWAVKEVVKQQEIKTIKGEMWLYNSVSGFFYLLRDKKDIFATLAQSTGSFIFDTLLKNVITLRPQLTAQFHDELVLIISEGNREKCEKLINDAIAKTNEDLKLNIDITASIKFGKNYADVK